jgi:outer membrane lipoprotein carrier protein
MKRVFRVFLPMLLAPLAHAAPAPDGLHGFLAGVDTLAARFVQVQKDEEGRVLQESSGRLELARPGRFRWAYEKPYEQLVVCDGKTLWLYDPDLEQVTVRPAGATLQGTPAQLLADRTALDRHFAVEEAGAEGGERKLRLVPRAADSDFRSVEIWLREGAPRRMRFHDQLGGISEVSFSEVTVNKPIDARRFAFEPPAGVEVILAEER